ncbi:DUF6090 family protein [Marinirhabdus gelatinilytica]|uniref:Uncharacterized protein n=1 Tax=Marinirhabdus gelatinilytica TaxID=1703343 RepID=A0A370QF78_9FLAO|nr:DUF6090 family protein [Marinirhabdus gelatinilytica]RDK87027.1 hypothetical protein C8D94_102205 [Marinirhabdus gelatinilytica]
MIKFFRKIRQRLVAESKFSKYLLYAIGEIVLVVIGILIALEINTWNDAKKEKNELHHYLAKISNNIAQDIKNLKVIKTRRQEINEACKKAFLDFQNDEFDLYTNMGAAGVFIEFYFTPNQSGYEALKNSSYLGKITGTRIDNLIDSYNAILNKNLLEEANFIGYVENMEVLWTSKFDMAELTPIYQSQTKINFEDLDIGLQRNLKAAFIDETFRSTVTRGAVQTTNITYYEQLIAIGEELIQEINIVVND